MCYSSNWGNNSKFVLMPPALDAVPALYLNDGPYHDVVRRGANGRPASSLPYSTIHFVALKCSKMV